MGWIIFIVILVLAEYYSFLIVRSAVRKFPRRLRIGFISLHIILTVFVEGCMMFFRHIHWDNYPDMLRNIFVAVAMGMIIGKLLVLVIMLLDDVRRFFIWIYNKLVPKKEEIPEKTGSLIPRSTFIMRAALGVAGLSLSGFVYGMRNRYRYHVRRIRITSPKLPEAFKGMKIVQISDIHTGSFDNHAAVEAGIQKILDLKPDIIFFTGDLVNNRTDEVDDKFKEIYSKLRAPMGVFSTLGNHDYGDYETWDSDEAKKKNLDDIIALHADMGWRLLMNEHVLLQRGNDSIGLIGVENITGFTWRFHTYGDMAKAYAGIEEKKAPFKILLSHDPSHWDSEVVEKYKDVDLTLSGHTHGMQFGVEIPGVRWSPIQYVYKNWAGLYTKDEQHLYINRGFGFLGYPGRLGILAEITLIELG
ncbi:MAG TPA: metallophosphoesterase [Flavipsychrobacter sp.]|nr:metallophosphoesterase [Flavipsychrobacter sp.]